MNKTLKLLLVLGLIGFTSEGLLAPIYAIFVEKVGGSLLDAGGAFSVFAIVTGVLIFFLGRLADRVGRELMVMIGFLIATLANLGYLLVGQPWHIFVVQVALGIGAAFSVSAWDGLYSRNLGKGRESTHWSNFEGCFSIALGIAAIFGAFIVSSLGFAVLFVLMAAMCFIAAMIALRLYIGNRKKRA